MVGKALTDDNVAAVKARRKSGDLLSPSKPHTDYWSKAELTFRALVVSPFVLMQEVKKATGPLSLFSCRTR